MSHSRNHSAGWIPHAIMEIAAAAGVLSAAVILAVVLPALDAGSEESAGEADGDDLEAARAGVTPQWPEFTSVKRYRRPPPKTAPNVAPRFAINAIKCLMDRFDFARQKVIARGNVTDADVMEVVQLAQLGDAEPTTIRAEELVLWDWLINIEDIDLSGAANITDASVEEIAKLPGITSLNLDGARITDRSLAALTTLKELTFLNVSHTSVSDHGLRALSELSQLEILEVSQTSIGDETIAAIVQRNPRLQSLTLAETQATGACLRFVGRLEMLGTLDLAGCQIDDNSLEEIADLWRLNSLGLANTPITDSAIPALVSYGQLIELDLRGSQVGRQGCRSLEAALPECSITF